MGETGDIGGRTGADDTEAIKLDVAAHRRPTLKTVLATTCLVTAILGLGAAALVGVVMLLLAIVSASSDASDAVTGLLLTTAGTLALLGVVWWGRRRRIGAWLDGTTLVLRSLYESAMCDLATAQVEVGEERMPLGRGGPLLIVIDTASGTELRVPLRGIRGGPVPVDQLTALADALATGPRPPQDGDQVERIVARLRQLAQDPLNGTM